MSGSNSFLSPNDFEAGQHPFPEFKLRADHLIIDSTEIRNVTFDAHYDIHMRLVLVYVVKNEFVKSTATIKSIKISGRNFPEPIELIATKISLRSSAEARMTLTPQREPLLVQFSSSATIAEAVITNGPEIIWSGMNLDFCHGDYLISLKEFPSVGSLRKQTNLLKRDRIATGIVSIRHINGIEFDPETAFQKISHLDGFLTFVKGVHCGIGNIIGRKRDGTIAFVYLGFPRIDQFHIATGWCDMTVIKSIPQIYKLYSKAVSINDDTTPILRTIEFYRASNMARESSLEMAIVASHASLETIIPHLLKAKAGWSSNLLNKQISFHDKLRATASFVGLMVNPFDHLIELQNRSKAMSNVDAFELLSIFRNRIVHQGKPFKYTGKELMEIWSMSQWLCEIFLFFWFEYRGDMNDRRQYHGWRGEMIGPVPLPHVTSSFSVNCDGSQ